MLVLDPIVDHVPKMAWWNEYPRKWEQFLPWVT